MGVVTMTEVQVAIGDSSARKLAEELRVETEQQFRVAFLDAPIGMALVAPSGRFIRVNQALCDLVGYGASDLIAKTFADITHPDDLDVSVEAVGKLLRGELKRFQVEKRYVRSDGSSVWAYTSTSLVADSAGSPRYFLTQIQDIDARKQAQNDLHHAAWHDDLTGLGNRRQLAEVGAHGPTRDGRSVVVVDLDRFKAINDTYGHAVGDGVLRAVADRLRAIVREDDLLVRLGGDEFVILVGSADPRYMEALGERAYRAVCSPFAIEGADVFLSCSIGIASGTSGEPVSRLLTHADACMYRIKTSGSARRVAIFDPDEHVDVLDALALSVELRAAIGRGEMLVHYQPIVEFASRRTLGFEALVRWAHPTRGMIPPLAFIPLAEQSGLMPELGAWVLEQACRQARLWQSEFVDAPYVSVNLSVRQLEDADFVGRLEHALGRARLAPRQLVVEVTESVLVTDRDAVAAPLERMRAMGVRVHLDDFGTGYSSLGYIRELPLDGVKLDRAFTRDLTTSADALAIARAVVTLLGKLDLTLVAEGIESAAHLAQLRSLGCSEGQGYYFARPQPAHALAGLLGGGASESST